MVNALTSCVFWGIILLLLWMVRPSSGFYNKTIEEWDIKSRIVTFFLIAAIIASSSFLMTLIHLYNGKKPDHRNQYELITEAFLKGQLYFDYDDIDPKLLEMENPYSYGARQEAGVKFHWDHAFYKGKYYMYFGVVPVLMLFMPYRLITGTSLTTYHATQIFTALTVIGLFAVFRFLSRKYFKDLPIGLYQVLSVLFAMMSIMYSTSKPALYQTAISSGVCLEIWSLFFFLKAVLDTENVDRAIALAAAGSLLGALVFGCRPTVALANLVVIPLLVIFIKKHGISAKLLAKTALAALPYVIVAAGLMWYNYARFENPFEFGQSYQLTVADQTGYSGMSALLDVKRNLQGIKYCFLSMPEVKKEFPFMGEGGLFLMYPILFYILIGAVNEQTRKRLRESGLMGWICTIAATVLLIVVMSVVWTPKIELRYTEDYTWMLCIIAFAVIGFLYQTMEFKRPFCARVSYVAFFSAMICVLVLTSQMMDKMSEEELALVYRAAQAVSFGLIR